MDWLYVAQDTQAEGTVLPDHLETKPLMCHSVIGDKPLPFMARLFHIWKVDQPPIKDMNKHPIYHLLGTSVKLVTYTSETKLHSRKTF